MTGPRPRPRATQRGGALVEYALVLGVLLLALLVGTGGQQAPLTQLLDALRNAYTSFVYALSISWF
ncbi:hypothetical protein LF63_0101645 [Oleiagrimonas soli]|uniref:Uncharacterized protein n=1 Tax=Oleiagrimonas soli TaxID=1543381 RepID=A0A099CZJ3_9GAMM|nr:hypothetical protein LF63_0101645 [Oleiagrimonas soli]